MKTSSEPSRSGDPSGTVGGHTADAGGSMAEGLVVTDLSKTYVSGGRDILVLDHLSLTMKAGQNAAIVGPSGCGKSTFLYILGTLETPTSGTVTISGCRPFELEPVAQSAFRNQTIGFVFQDHHLLPQLSVRENVLLPALAMGAISDQQAARAEQLLERVGLSHRLSQLPGQLSGGERQRVAVARALLMRPRLILADEPTGSLDEANSDKISELLLEMQAEHGSMLLCVTHNPNLANRFQQTLTLSHGRFAGAN